MLLISFFLLLFLLIVYALLVPIDLFINTNTNQYYVQIRGFAKVSIEKDNVEIIRIKLRMFFMNFYLYPLKYTGFKEKKKIDKKHKIKRKFGLKKGLQIFKSFKIKRFNLEIDTGDYTLNAKLYPVFVFLNYNVGHFKVNFEDRNQLVLHLQNRPINIIKLFFHLKT